MNHNLKKWNKSKALAYIEELSLAFKKSRTLLTAMHFDIFTLIGERSLSAEDIANQLNISYKGVERLLNALVAIKLLGKKELKFFNTESAKVFLVQGSSDYLGNMEHLSSLWDTWGDLNESVEKGKPINYQDLSEKDDEWIEAYISSNHWKACIESKEIIKSINLRNVNKVLDLGGGTGKYAVEFVKAKSDIQAVVVDYPNVVEHTQDYIAKSGLSDKITTLAGNYLELESYGNDFDLVIISNIIQYNSIWTNVKMLQKIYDSLKSGGQLVIHDQIISDDRTQPEKAALYALNMLVNTLDGNCYTETDIWIMMKEAWFKDISRTETTYESSLMFGVK